MTAAEMIGTVRQAKKTAEAHLEQTKKLPVDCPALPHVSETLYQLVDCTTAIGEFLGNGFTDSIAEKTAEAVALELSKIGTVPAVKEITLGRLSIKGYKPMDAARIIGYLAAVVFAGGLVADKWDVGARILRALLVAGQ